VNELINVAVPNRVDISNANLVGDIARFSLRSTFCRSTYPTTILYTTVDGRSNCTSLEGSVFQLHGLGQVENCPGNLVVNFRPVYHCGVFHEIVLPQGHWFCSPCQLSRINKRTLYHLSFEGKELTTQQDQKM